MNLLIQFQDDPITNIYYLHLKNQFLTPSAQVEWCAELYSKIQKKKKTQLVNLYKLLKSKESIPTALEESNLKIYINFDFTILKSSDEKHEPSIYLNIVILYQAIWFTFFSDDYSENEIINLVDTFEYCYTTHRLPNR